ncbi:CPBP family intramembrane glutamic endopeptidase [Propionimicrobium sp. PCR01-08-3]|uniref:CPBP family intramembrane glutamic endopeptidase n=1 Tax=Propionimicrobium sp. PCR01-08-3 TaxID=3052086 RepID=UPI00255C86D6|nr:CPBP family intramembrane glutamic endopeptidase [Propionimicrobium sp. PCR01-08-3]WIY82421.1 CPBP family intramembrane metalloprotease [Propionimicrobium sp. PCR01-08-3]
MTEFVLFCVPTIIYVAVQSRGKDRSLNAAMQRAGACWGAPSGYAWALALLLPLVFTGWLSIVLIPTEVIEMPGFSIARLTSVGAAMGTIFRAVGEEIFFRGLLGGVLMRRLGFGWGNLIQAILFLIPHFALLLVDTRVWPVIPVQFAAGWLLGWLRHKTGTFLPGGIVHGLVNIASGLVAL